MNIKVQDFNFTVPNNRQAKTDTTQISKITPYHAELPKNISATLQAYNNISFAGKLFGGSNEPESLERGKLNLIIKKLKQADQVKYFRLKGKDIRIEFNCGNEDFYTTIMYPGKLKVFRENGKEPTYLESNEDKLEEIKQLALFKIEQKLDLPEGVLAEALENPLSILLDERIDLDWTDNSIDVGEITDRNYVAENKSGKCQFEIRKYKLCSSDLDRVYLNLGFLIKDNGNRTGISLPVNEEIFDEAEEIIKDKLGRNKIENKSKIISLADYKK